MTRESEITRTRGSTSLRLLLRAQRGEQSAVQQLLVRILPGLRAWARGRLPLWARARADTDDLVQDAVGALLRRLERLDPTRRHAIRAYLQQAIRNRILDEVRRAGTVEVAETATLDPAAPGSSPLDRAIASENARRYRDGLARLDDGDRELIVGRIELGYSYEQLALATARPSPDAARVAVRRALVRLAAAMGDGGRGQGLTAGSR